MISYIVTISILLIFFSYSNYRSRWEASVVIFVAFIVQGVMIPAEQQFFGFIDQRSIVAIILLFNGIFYKKIETPFNSLDEYKKIAFFLGVFTIIILTRYIEIKNGILFGGLEIAQILKRILRDSINLFAIYIIIKRMYFKSTLKGLENGIFLGLIIAIFSMLAPEFFIDRGFALNVGSIDPTLRLTGFLSLDVNEASGVFNMIYGYILAKTERSKRFKIKYILIIGLLITGILLGASRTGFVSFLLITIIFIIRNSTITWNALKHGLVIIIISALLFNYFGDLMFERIKQYQTGEHDSLASRQTYWRLFINDIVENPNYLIIGNLGKPTYHRAVHNQYIAYLFYAGIFSLIVLLNIFWRFYKYRDKYHNNYMYYTPIYSLLAILITWFTVGHLISYWFILIIAASSGIPVTTKKSNVY